MLKLGNWRNSITVSTTKNVQGFIKVGEWNWDGLIILISASPDCKYFYKKSFGSSVDRIHSKWKCVTVLSAEHCYKAAPVSIQLVQFSRRRVRTGKSYKVLCACQWYFAYGVVLSSHLAIFRRNMPRYRAFSYNTCHANSQSIKFIQQISMQLPASHGLIWKLPWTLSIIDPERRNTTRAMRIRNSLHSYK